MKPKTRKALTVAGASALVAVIAVAIYLLWRKRRNGGVLVIGGTQNNANMNTTPNTNGSLGTQFTDTSLPLGYRNNNPLNILYGSSLWKGKVIPNTDKSSPRKEQFVSMAYGYRAALYLLRKHIRNGYNTLARLVNRWGTGANSDAETAYVRYVSNKAAIAPASTLSPDDMESLCRIAWAMAGFENGKLPTSMDAIYQGWALL